MLENAGNPRNWLMSERDERGSGSTLAIVSGVVLLLLAVPCLAAVVLLGIWFLRHRPPSVVQPAPVVQPMPPVKAVPPTTPTPAEE